MFRLQRTAGSLARRCVHSASSPQATLWPFAAASACGAATFALYNNGPVLMQQPKKQVASPDEWITGMTSEGYHINMPLDLVLVRHGQSEANMMIAMKLAGDMRGQELMDSIGRHDSMMRLTDVGRAQARHAGKWVKEHIGVFDKFFVSQYVRTKETAAEMGLDNALWMHDMLIRERDQGVQDGQGDVKLGLTSEEKARNQKSPMYWAPIAGESMSEVCQRVRLFLMRLQMQANGLRAIVVCHYRTIHAFRLLLEDPKQSDYEALLSEPMPNGAIWWYSRRDDNGRVHLHIVTCKRIIVKSDGTAEVTSFPVRPRPQTNEQLREDVNRVPQKINNPAD